MTAQELRIGNWVSWYDDKDDQFQMDSVTKTNGRLVNPIPLTEEWLLKFGFESQLRGTIKDYLKFNSNRVSEMLISSVNCIEWTTYGVRYDIQYVHQLQNLYFALTGSELTIKE